MDRGRTKFDFNSIRFQQFITKFPDCQYFKTTFTETSVLRVKHQDGEIINKHKHWRKEIVPTNHEILVQAYGQ